MSDYLDRPMTTPAYPTHGTPPGSTVDLGDDGHIPRRQARLLMAWELFCSKHSGHQLTNGNQDSLRAWCWEQADKFLAESDSGTAFDIEGD